MKRIFATLALLSFVVFVNAQIYIDNEGNVYDQSKPKQQNVKQKESKSYSKKGFDKSKLEFGGSLGLQFGDYTQVNISPQVGYRFSKYFSGGAGIGYSYYNNDRHNSDLTEHFASFNLYGTLYPVNFIVLSVKPEISRMWQTEKYMNKSFTYNKFVPSVVLGGGVRFGSMTAQIKYDVIQDDYSPYGNRVFYSVGYTFGL